MIVVKVRVFLLITVVVAVVFVNGSEAEPFFQMFHRKLGDFHITTHQSISQSPAPAPGPGSAASSDGGRGPGGLVGVLTEERCPLSQRIDSTRSCHDDLLRLNFTACLVNSSTAPKELYLIVQNDGEGLLEVNVTILNTKFSFPLMQIPHNQAKKFTISKIVEGSNSLILNAGSGKCKIHIGSVQSDNKFYKQLSAYASNLSPLHGAYFLFLTTLVIGGIWACCKLGKSDRHVDGVRYQELEMGQPEAESHTANNNIHNNVETAEGWDEGWDDEWEEEKKQVNPPNGHQTQTPTSRTSAEDGWENDSND